MSLNQQESLTLQKLERTERHYHLFKAGLILACTIFIVAFMTYEGNKSVNNVNSKNKRVENLLRCSLPAFTPQNYQSADKIINKCLGENK